MPKTGSATRRSSGSLRERIGPTWTPMRAPRAKWWRKLLREHDWRIPMPPDKAQPVLVIGGTRGTGLLIARLLCQRGQRVRVLARDPRRAASLFDSSVEIFGGDLTKPETLAPAINGARHLIFTAGCRSGYPVREPRVKAVEFDGVVQTVAAARQVGFSGRFLYMTSSGVMTENLAARCLNLWKGNTLVWRRRVEDEIRASGVDYTVIRTRS